MFNRDDIARYSRQLMIPEIGINGQHKLQQAKVLVIGAGGLGSPVLFYLAAAGIGTIGIADFDSVDISNLQRQILFTESDINKNKAHSAAEQIAALNSRIKINILPYAVSRENVMCMIEEYDVIVDTSDNFLTRYLVNDACCLQQKPLVYASLFRLEGQIAVFNLTKDAPCYRCLYPNPPPTNMIPNCSQGGALGSVAGVLGSMQAIECIKIILNKGNILSGKMLNANLLELDFYTVQLKKQPECFICHDNDYTALDPCWYEFDALPHICNKVKTITKNDLTILLKHNKNLVNLINVKETWESQDERIKYQAISMPLSNLETDLASVMDKLLHHGHNIFYCQDGSRSEYAVALLEREFGLLNLYNYKGNPQEIEY